MISCSQCGTQNRDGSKFCNNCGTRLAPGALGLPRQPAAPQGVPGTSQEASIPEWLQSQSAVSNNESAALARPEENAQDVDSSAQEEYEMPDWLARLRAASPEEEPRTPSGDSANPGDSPNVSGPGNVPNWIKNLRDQEPAEPPVGPAAEEPDWLRQLRANATEQSPSPQAQWVTPSSPEGDGASSEDETVTADWLAANMPSQEASQAELSVPAFSVSADSGGIDASNLSDWCQDAQAPTAPSEQPAGEQVAESAATLEEPEPEQTESSGLGEPSGFGESSGFEQFFTEATDETFERSAFGEPSEVGTAASATAEQLEGLPTADLPDWLRAAMPTQGRGGLPGTGEPAVEQPSPGEIPTWIKALKPVELQVKAGRQEKPETSGPLEGLRGVIPLALAVTEPHSPPRMPSPNWHTGAGPLFDAILAEPREETTPRSSRRVRPVWTMRPIIYLLLALAVIIPLLVPPGLTAQVLSTPSASEFHNTLRAVPPNSTVLISFDYEPSLAGEMDLQANAIVRDLLARQVKIIAVSTIETGPQMAQNILVKAATGKNLRYGSEFLNLGFLPGHEAGLAQLAVELPAKDMLNQKLTNYPLTVNMKNLSGVALVVELAGSEDALRMWMEQVQARTRLRIAAGVSAAVEPKARVYRDAGQLVAILSGLTGAANYELLSNQPGLAVTSLNAQNAGTLVLLFIILLGNVMHWVSRARVGDRPVGTGHLPATEGQAQPPVETGPLPAAKARSGVGGREG